MSQFVNELMNQLFYITTINNPQSFIVQSEMLLSNYYVNQRMNKLFIPHDLLVNEFIGRVGLVN
ncbi:MAG: hypothetical protein ACJA1Z_003874 [Patiriisocius sp.]|jgi:hypothetical protein